MLFNILQTVTWKIRGLLLMILLLCVLLFGVFLYYGDLSTSFSRLAMSKSQLINYSVDDKLRSRVDLYDFAKAKKSLNLHKEFLSNIDGYRELNGALAEAQTFPKYIHLLEVFKNKVVKFQTYTSNRVSSIDRQLIDLIRKIEREKIALNKQVNFHKFIQDRFSKISRITKNISLGRKTKKEIQNYLKIFNDELQLLENLVEARNLVLKRVKTFHNQYQKYLKNLDSLLLEKTKYLNLMKSIVFTVIGFTLIGLLTLLGFSFYKGGTLKLLNRELESWLLDYSRSLFERDTLSLSLSSEEFQSSLHDLLAKYGDVQVIGELVESKLPFSVVLASMNGEVIWGNKAFYHLNEGYNFKKLSDLWDIEDSINLSKDDFEGVCELKADGCKYEYFAVPLKKHEKYFIVFSPLKRVENSQKKMISEYLKPIKEALEGIRDNTYIPKNFEWRKYPQLVRDILEVGTSVHSMIEAERIDTEKRLELLLNNLKKSEQKLQQKDSDFVEIKKRLDSYREGVRMIKSYYVQMVDKQDLASEILIKSVEQHDKAISLCTQVVNYNDNHIDGVLKLSFDLQKSLEKLKKQSSDIGLSKLSLYNDQVIKILQGIKESQFAHRENLKGFTHLIVDDYQKLSEELGEIDRHFIDLISNIYEDIVHLDYRIKGEKKYLRPRGNA